MRRLSPRKLGILSQQDLPTIGEGDDVTYDPKHLNSETVLSVRSDIPQPGKIPYSANENESVGFGGSDVAGVIDYRVAPALGEDTDAESSDAESVFQPHLENVLKNIKKAKATKKKKIPVPDVAGLIPTVIPQLRMDEVQGGDVLRTADNIRSGASVRLKVQPHVPRNTPPPSAQRLESSEALPEHSENSKPLQLSNGLSHDKAEEIVADQESSKNMISQVNPSGTAKLSGRSVVRHPAQSGSPANGGSNEMNGTEVRIMTASVDLGLVEDGALGSKRETPSRLEVVITSMPSAPPASLATSSETEVTDTEDRWFL